MSSSEKIDEQEDFPKREGPASDHYYLQGNVKRQNLIDLFLRGTEVDNYIAKNLFGNKK